MSNESKQSSPIGVVVKEFDDCIKKYEKYVGNLEWHIKVNKPEQDKKEDLQLRIFDYKEVIKDLKKLQSLAGSQWASPRPTFTLDDMLECWAAALKFCDSVWEADGRISPPKHQYFKEKYSIDLANEEIK